MFSLSFMLCLHSLITVHMYMLVSQPAACTSSPFSERAYVIHRKPRASPHPSTNFIPIHGTSSAFNRCHLLQNCKKIVLTSNLPFGMSSNSRWFTYYIFNTVVCLGHMLNCVWSYSSHNPNYLFPSICPYVFLMYVLFELKLFVTHL